MILIQDGSQNTNVDKPLRIIGDPYKVQVRIPWGVLDSGELKGGQAGGRFCILWDLCRWVQCGEIFKNTNFEVNLDPFLC